MPKSTIITEPRIVNGSASVNWENITEQFGSRLDATDKFAPSLDVSVLKASIFRGASSQPLWPGLCAWTPLEVQDPNSHYRLLRSPRAGLKPIQIQFPGTVINWTISTTPYVRAKEFKTLMWDRIAARSLLDAGYCYRRHDVVWSVCLSVSLLVTTVNPAKRLNCSRCCLAADSCGPMKYY